MKKSIVALLAALGCTALGAEEVDISSYSLWDFHPIHAGGNLIRLGKANVTDTPDKGHLFYRKSNAFLYALLPISAKSYFFPRIEWNTFTLNWTKNPKFNQDHFYYAQFALTFYSTALDRWRWIVRGEYNLDLEHFSNPHLYGLFSGLLWGTYELFEKWRYHLGGVGYSGMRGSQIYPIIGLDYTLDEHWVFLAVFPIEYYAMYKIDSNWRLAAKIRPLKERFRTGKKEPQPRSIFSYSSVGAEFNAHYEIFMRLEVEAYVGYNFGGSFYIKNSKGHNSLYTDVGGAPYCGLTLDWGF